MKIPQINTDLIKKVFAFSVFFLNKKICKSGNDDDKFSIEPHSSILKVNYCQSLNQLLFSCCKRAHAGSSKRPIDYRVQGCQIDLKIFSPKH